LFPLKDNLDNFIQKIKDVLCTLDINNDVPIEPDFRFHLARMLQEVIDDDTHPDMQKISLFLERDGFDLVLFYKPVIGEPFAEIIELKRGSRDNDNEFKASTLEDYFLTKPIVKYSNNKVKYNDLAKDLSKLVKAVIESQQVNIKRANYKPTAWIESYPVKSGLFILLCPDEKKFLSGWKSKTFRQKIVKTGADFWFEGKGSDFLLDNYNEKLIVENKSLLNLQSEGQETAEFLEFILITKKNNQ